MTARLEKQTVAIHIFSRSKGNRTMKFGQLKEYNIRNIFIEKSCRKCGGEAILRPLHK